MARPLMPDHAFKSRGELLVYLRTTRALVLVQVYEGQDGWIKASKGEAVKMLRTLEAESGDLITDCRGKAGSIRTNWEGDVSIFPHTI